MRLMEAINVPEFWMELAPPPEPLSAAADTAEADPPEPEPPPKDEDERELAFEEERAETETVVDCAMVDEVGCPPRRPTIRGTTSEA